MLLEWLAQWRRQKARREHRICLLRKPDKEYCILPNHVWIIGEEKETVILCSPLFDSIQTGGQIPVVDDPQKLQAGHIKFLGLFWVPDNRFTRLFWLRDHDQYIAAFTISTNSAVAVVSREELLLDIDTGFFPAWQHNEQNYLSLIGPCGTKQTWEKREDIPETSVPCSCGNPEHWFIKYETPV